MPDHRKSLHLQLVHERETSPSCCLQFALLARAFGTSGYAFLNFANLLRSVARAQYISEVPLHLKPLQKHYKALNVSWVTLILDSYCIFTYTIQITPYEQKLELKFEPRIFTNTTSRLATLTWTVTYIAL